MFQTLLIGLREGLEAALVVTILLGAVTKLGRADVRPRIWLGTGLAVLLALVVGAVLTFGSLELAPRIEETIAGGLSVVAVGFVTWMVFWMVGHGGTLASSLRSDVGRALVGGGWGVVLVAFLSVGREGVETSLFVWSAVQSAGSDVAAALGALIGFTAAIVLAALIARGLVRLDLGRFFTITGAFLVLVAAGVLSYGVGDLQEAGLLPGAGAVAYDVSGAVPPESWYGSLLQGLAGFSPVATWLQAAVGLVYLVLVGTGFVLALRRREARPVRAVATTA